MIKKIIHQKYLRSIGIRWIIWLYAILSFSATVTGSNPYASYQKGHDFEENFHFDSALVYYAIAGNLALKQNDTITAFKAATKKAVCRMYQFKLEKSQKEIDSLDRYLNEKYQRNNELVEWFKHAEGIYLFLTDHYNEAASLCNQSLLDYKTKYNKEHPEKIIILGIIAYCTHMEKDLTSSEYLFKQYQSLLIEKYSRISGGNLVFCLYMANTYHFQGEFQLTQNYFDEAFKISAELSDGQYYLPLLHRWYATFIMNQADLTANDQEKEKAYRLALSLCKEGLQFAVRQNKPFRIAHCYTMLGRATSFLSNAQTAESYFNKALAQIKIAIPFPSDEQVNIISEYARTFLNEDKCTKVLKILDSADETLTELQLNSQYSNFDLGSDFFWIKSRCLNALDQNILALNNVQKALLSHNNKPFDQATNYELPNYQMLAKYREALEYQAYKIKILDKLGTASNNEYYHDLLLTNGLTFDSLFNDVFVQFIHDWSKQSLQEVVYDTYNLLIRAHLKSNKTNDLYYALKYSEKTRSIRLMEDRFHSPASMQEVQTVFSQYEIDALKNQIEAIKTTSLLEYFEGDEHTYAFLVQDQKLSVHLIGSTKDLKDQIKNYTATIINFPGFLRQDLTQYATYRQDFIQLSHWLYTKMIKPIPIKYENLVIIGQAFTTLIPFESLVTRIPDHSNTWDLDYLIHDFKICYQPTIAMTAEKPSPNKASKSKRLVMGFKDSDLTWGRKEIDWLTKNQNFEQLYLDVSDTADHSPVASKIIHIIGHAGLDKNGLPFLIDHQSTLGGDTLRINNAHKFQADFIFLSVCESGKGKHYKGEGIASLANQFLSNGSSAILASMWRVQDAVTHYITKAFYQNNQVKVSDKIYDAKIKYLKNNKSYYLHPYYWAPFVVIGDAKIQPVDHFEYFAGILDHSMLWISILLIVGTIMFKIIMNKLINQDNKLNGSISKKS